MLTTCGMWKKWIAWNWSLINRIIDTLWEIERQATQIRRLRVTRCLKPNYKCIIWYVNHIIHLFIIRYLVKCEQSWQYWSWKASRKLKVYSKPKIKEFCVQKAILYYVWIMNANTYYLCCLMCKSIDINWLRNYWPPNARKYVNKEFCWYQPWGNNERNLVQSAMK